VQPISIPLSPLALRNFGTNMLVTFKTLDFDPGNCMMDALSPPKSYFCG
jgi:hypothetical protein